MNMKSLRLPVKGCKTLVFNKSWGLRSLITKGALSCHACYDTGARFLLSRPKEEILWIFSIRVPYKHVIYF